MNFGLNARAQGPALTDEPGPASGPLAGLGMDMAAAAVFGMLTSGPIGSLAGLQPLFERGLRLAADEVRYARAKSLLMIASAADTSGVEADDLLELAESDDDKRQLWVSAAEAASHARYPEKIIALGRALAMGTVAEDRVQVDREQMVVDALREIERPHVVALAALTRTTSHGELDVTEAHWLTLDQLKIDIGLYAPVLAPTIATLQWRGLATQHSREPGPVTFKSVGSEPHWGPTDFGLEVFARLRAVGLDAAESDAPGWLNRDFWRSQVGDVSE